MVGMNQNAISRLESPWYGKATIRTLKRLAAAFDVGLVIRFVPFSKLVNWVSGTPYWEEGISPESLAVSSFTEELPSLQVDMNVRSDLNQEGWAGRKIHVFPARKRRRSVASPVRFMQGQGAGTRNIPAEAIAQTLGAQLGLFDDALHPRPEREISGLNVLMLTNRAGSSSAQFKNEPVGERRLEGVRSYA